MPKSRGLGIQSKREQCSPVDDNWFTVVTDTSVAATTPYDPVAADFDEMVSMAGFTHVAIRSKMATATDQTGTYVVYGVKDGEYFQLSSTDDDVEITLALSAPAHVDSANSQTYTSIVRFDALGAKEVGVLVSLADGNAATGDIIQLTRY